MKYTRDEILKMLMWVVECMHFFNHKEHIHLCTVGKNKILSS